MYYSVSHGDSIQWLCYDYVNELYIHVMLLFSQGEDGVLQDGEAQLMMGRMLTLLQASYSNDSVVMYICVCVILMCVDGV